MNKEMRVETASRRSTLQRWWWVSAIGGVDREAVLEQISEDSGWSGRYLFLILVSAAIALLGLLIPSPAVVIGAMLLSPLMSPIIGLGFGIATLDFAEIRRAGTALALGSVVGVLSTAALVAISPVQTITSEIAARTQPTLFDLLVALLSALAGSYALIRGRGGAVFGVAIATALMPPLAVVGFGLATTNWTVFSGSLLLFLTNAVTIALTAALMARIYGFGSHLSPHHTGWQLALFAIALGVLSIPLGASLKRIALEAVVQTQARDVLVAQFPDQARLSQLDIDYTKAPVRVRAVMLTPKVEAGADARFAQALQARLGQPVNVHVDQVRISPETGAVEVAQIARAAENRSRTVEAEREAAVADLALIAGTAPGAVQSDEAGRRLRATAALLPGLELAGYRALEERARQALDGRTVELVPPAEVGPPPITIEAGVIDDAALGLAAWGSQRLGRVLDVEGGTSAQREAVAAGLVARGGRAEVGAAGGALRLAWQAPPEVEGTTE